MTLGPSARRSARPPGFGLPVQVGSSSSPPVSELCCASSESTSRRSPASPAHAASRSMHAPRQPPASARRDRAARPAPSAQASCVTARQQTSSRASRRDRPRLSCPCRGRRGSRAIRGGAPGGNRTPGLQVRSLSLYPSELRAHNLTIRNSDNIWSSGYLVIWSLIVQLANQ